MQNTATFRTVTRGAVQLVVLAAVAAVGVGVGRWVVPEGGAAGSSTVRYIEATAPDTGAATIERKLAQIDALDASLGTAVAGAVTGPVAPAASSSVIERKLEQMDALDSRLGTTIAAPSFSGNGSTIDRKLAQMDALNARIGSPANSGSTMERKFAEMAERDARNP